MELTQQIVEHITRAAKLRARRLNIDPEIAVSLAYGYLVDIGKEVNDVNTLYAHVYYALKTRLLADFYDEIRVYGPKSTTLRQRRFRGKVPGTVQRASPEHLQAVTVRNITHDFDFLDTLPGPLQHYVLLTLAGYTHTELITDFGFTRSKLETFRQELSHVFTKPSSCRRV
jgi:hypothetical protein